MLRLGLPRSRQGQPKTKSERVRPHTFGFGFRLALPGPRQTQAKEANRPACGFHAVLPCKLSDRKHPEDCDPLLPRPNCEALLLVLDMVGKRDDEYFAIARTLRDPASREIEMRHVNQVAEVYDYLVRTHRIEHARHFFRWYAQTGGAHRAATAGARSS